MNVLDFSTGNAQVTDEIINVSDANPVTLKHDTFYNKAGKAIVISTGAGGSGTVLVNPLDGASDYTPGGAYTFPEPYNTTLAGDVGYTTIAITNAAYHATILYVSYYPIWDLLYASRWNNNNIIPHYKISPYDISATTIEIDLANFNSWPVGTSRRVHAYDGDGSNYLHFTNNGETINGISISDFKIIGTGGLILTKVADGEFIAKGWLGGDVFDQDGGNFTGTFNKTLCGKCNYDYWSYIQGNASATISAAITIPALFSEIENIDGSYNGYKGSAPASLVDTAGTLSLVSAELVMSSLTAGSVYLTRGTSAFGNTSYFLYSICINGRWTASHPGVA